MLGHGVGGQGPLVVKSLKEENDFFGSLKEPKEKRRLCTY